MPIINRIANFAEDMNQWRQELHSNPELKFDCYETASSVSYTHLTLPTNREV